MASSSTGRWLALAAVCSACALLEPTDVESTHGPDHAPAKPAPSPPPAGMGGVAGAHADGATDADGEHSSTADVTSDAVEDPSSESDAAAGPIFTCTKDAATVAPEDCVFIVSGYAAPCFATLQAACDCMGCPLTSCQPVNRLCFLKPLADGGFAPCPKKLYCSDAGGSDASEN